MTHATELARELIRCPSVTPDDAGCQKIIAERLTTLGFSNRQLPFGTVSNLWSVRGDSGPLFVFAGHTDVVPPGDTESWRFAPFAASIDEGKLYGRGAADMKSSIAAFLIACEQFIKSQPDNKIRIGFLITSDEEGPAIDGTKKVIEWLINENVTIDYCIVGEPTSTEHLGDTIKIGRRGSLNGHLTIKGVQGHVAYAQLANNPVHAVAPALEQLTQCQWDDGNQFFPPTSFQVSNIHAGEGTENVIPATLELKFNFRYSNEVTDSALKQRVEEILEQHHLNYDIKWRTSGQPFLSQQGLLIQSSQAAITELTGLTTELSTSGGTSDARFIAPTGTEVIELGPINATIHQVNENVACADIELLADVYQKILVNLATSVEP